MEISRNGWNNSDSLKQRGLRPDLRLRRVTGDHPAFEKITSADRHAATMRVKGKFIPIKSLPESRRGKISVTFTVKWKKPSIVLNPMCVCVQMCEFTFGSVCLRPCAHVGVCRYIIRLQCLCWSTGFFVCTPGDVCAARWECVYTAAIGAPWWPR